MKMLLKKSELRRKPTISRYFSEFYGDRHPQIFILFSADVLVLASVICRDKARSDLAIT